MEDIDIRMLPDLFTWESGERLIAFTAKVRRRHRTFIAQRLAVHANREKSLHSNSSKGSGIIASLSQLPIDALSQIIGAPETCHQVYLAPEQGDDRLWQFIGDAIHAEQIRSGQTRRGDKGVWSALGDHYFAGSRFEGDEVDALKFGKIVCDVQSPFALAPIIASKFKPEFGNYEAFSSDELHDVLFKCFAATECLATASPSVWVFVENMVQTIMPRKDLVNPTFKGSSNRGIIGRTNLINPQLKDVDHTVVANSLIHESIHIALYYLEEIEGFFLSEQVAFDERILSPWSENLISPRAYVHGFFVWYGLHRYWNSLKCDGSGFAEDVIAHFSDFCDKGFRENRALNRLMKFSDSIRPDVLEALQDVQGRMNSFSLNEAPLTQKVKVISVSALNP